jgi:hypothetical protein
VPRRAARPGATPLTYGGLRCDHALVTEPRAPVDIPPLALSVDQAAASLGVSPNTFRRYVLPHVRSIKLGKVRIVPVLELEKWLHLNSHFTDND